MHYSVQETIHEINPPQSGPPRSGVSHMSVNTHEIGHYGSTPTVNNDFPQMTINLSTKNGTKFLYETTTPAKKKMLCQKGYLRTNSRKRQLAMMKEIKNSK